MKKDLVLNTKVWHLNIEGFIKLTQEEMTYPKTLKTKFGILIFYKIHWYKTIFRKVL